MRSEPQRLQAALAAWRTLLGDVHVQTDAATLARLRQDTMRSPAHACARLRPANSEEVAACLAIARQHNVALQPASTGNNWGYGGMATTNSHCVQLDLSRMDKILAFDEALAVVTLEPGVTQAALADYLASRDLPFLTPVTGAGPTCSVLANALERGFGITPVTDHWQAVMGLEAILPDGQRYRSPMWAPGTTPCFKWGVGPYLDGLFGQSGLGVVTQMSIALVRRPQVMQPFYFWVDSAAQLPAALDGVKRILDRCGSQVGGINLMNSTRLLSMAYDARPLTQLNQAERDTAARSLALPAWMGVGSIYCEQAQLASLKGIIRTELRRFSSRYLFRSQRQLAWASQALRLLPGAWSRRWRVMLDKLHLGMELMEGRPNQVALPLAYVAGARPQAGALLDPARDNCGLIWYAPILPLRSQQVATFVRHMEHVCQTHRLPCPVTLTTLSGRAIDCTLPLLFDRNDEKATARAEDCYRDLFNSGKQQGVLPYRLPLAFMHLLTDTQAPAWQLGQRLKHALDPQHLLAPGRYCPPAPATGCHSSAMEPLQ
ncbi:FAD-binding oxidoreductase [Pseudomonas sp. ESBL2]|uniref:FAD-binding oxidoreductase n=1 Tax=Pseudomonas sp. ESBL2 TaxID=3077325 RepID=UPI002FC8FF07